MSNVPISDEDQFKKEKVLVGRRLILFFMYIESYQCSNKRTLSNVNCNKLWTLFHESGI